jgi:hypothetical protein
MEFLVFSVHVAVMCPMNKDASKTSEAVALVRGGLGFFAAWLAPCSESARAYLQPTIPPFITTHPVTASLPAAVQFM